MGWAPLQVLMKKNSDFVWTVDCDAALIGVKAALTQAHVLADPDLNRPFEVICDACG